MKKSKSSKSKVSHHKKPVEDIIPVPDVNPNEESIAEDHFVVTGREDDATSSGHRVEPIFNDEEGNAEKLVEEGLHGYLHRSKKDR
jgi:hypothetical protein